MSTHQLSTSEIPQTSPVRIESDPLGQVPVPAHRLYGPQTQRALLNFPICGVTVAAMPALIRSLAQIKKAAALANSRTGELAADKAQLIMRSCDELIEGAWHDEFVVDVLQGGAGTSTNMNANEVIANRALELGGYPRGRYDVISPNDHVNRSQSTNDAYASATRLAVYALNGELMAALQRLVSALQAKADEFAPIAKLGRTQLQDAVPMTLGEEFGAYAAVIADGITRAGDLSRQFLTLNLGGTAIGTGIGASNAYREHIIEALREVTGLPVAAAGNLIGATWDMSSFVLYSGLLKSTAATLSKISNDLRLSSSGPRGGFGEIHLPQRQPGSSLMPGKVNPVIPEAMNQIAFRVFGLDATVTFAAEGGQLQLNAFEPVILWSIHEAVQLIVSGIDMMIARCLTGLEADADRCQQHLSRSTAFATALVPLAGYGRSAEIARLALSKNCSLREAVAALSPESLTQFDSIAGEPSR